MFLLPAAVVFVSFSALSQESKEQSKEIRNTQEATSALSVDTNEPGKKVKKSNTEWDQKLKEALNLTEKQIFQMDKINKDFITKVEALKKNTNLSADELKEKKMELKKQKEESFMEILTPEQLSIYKSLLENENKPKELQAVEIIMN